MTPEQLIAEWRERAIQYRRVGGNHSTDRYDDMAEQLQECAKELEALLTKPTETLYVRRGGEKYSPEPIRYVEYFTTTRIGGENG